MTEITIPDPSLVLLVGCSGAGKTTLARRLFDASEIVSLDACREMVCGTASDMSATEDAVAVAREIVRRRLRRRLLTVVDATNVQSEDRRAFVEIARDTHSLVSAIVLDPGQRVCHERAAARDEASYRPRVIEEQHRLLARNRRKLAKHDGIRVAVAIEDADTSDVTLVRRPLLNDLRHVRGPFDIIGDVHGCTDELEELLRKLGWTVEWIGEGEERKPRITHPEGRRLVFLGDVTDRGPRPRDALLMMEAAVSEGVGHAVASNHDDRVKRWLAGRDVTISHGMDATIADFEGTSDAFRKRIHDFLDRLGGHLVLDGGRIVVAHAGVREEMILGASREMRDFCVHGAKGPPDETGETSRIDWAREYRGKPAVVYGHVASDEAVWFHNTICIDTACVHGGSLTALRWPERELVSVDAHRVHIEPTKPLFSRKDARDPLLLSLDDVIGRRNIPTRYVPRIKIPLDGAAAAFEGIARYSIDPRWLIHLPPTMSPVSSSARPGYLEHPDEAFALYAKSGASRVVVQTKHMGSRGLVLVCRDAEVARRRFQAEDGHRGHIWTRTGRAFLRDADRGIVLDRLSAAAEGLFEALESDWVLLDAEIMPWNAKASELIRNQFAPTGVAAGIGASLALDALERFATRGVEAIPDESDLFRRRLANAEAFDRVWRGYCWETPGIEDIRIAPFHVLASEGRVHDAETHERHLRWIDAMIGRDPLLVPTESRIVDLGVPKEIEAAIERWEDATRKGAEGIVVKPLEFASRTSSGLLQPAVKVRGRDYLRIIYGPDYDLPANLDRLRERGVRSKRDRALKEFSLGMEALHRFVSGEALRRVHECVAGVLALESEPSDPRL